MTRYRLKKSLRALYDHSPPVGSIACVESACSPMSGRFYVETQPSADYLGSHRFVMDAEELRRFFEEIK